MKKKSLLLPLVALALVGCADKSKTTSPFKSNTDTPIQNSQSNKSVESTKPNTGSNTPSKESTIPSAKPSTGSASKSETSGSTDTTGGSSATSDTGSASSGSSTGSSDIYNTKWKKSIVDLMVEHLGGQVLPYVELGATVTPTWEEDKSLLTLIGSISTGINASRLQTAKADYEAAGWTVTTTEDSMTAVSAAEDITVVFNAVGADETFPGTLQLTATYKEPFDPTKASAWPSEIIDDMNANMTNHAADIPFVYLGTVRPTGSFDSDESTYAITGGEWNDQITTLAKNAFESANASIQNDTEKWVISNGTNTNGTTFNANITLADKTKFEVSIEAPYPSSATIKRHAEMKIKFKEGFAVPTGTSWPTEVTDVFTNNFGGHAFPYFYIGSTNPSVYVNSYSGTLEISGLVDTWDDQIPTLLKTALDNENAGISEVSQKWTYTENGSEITGSRTFADGCMLKFEFDHDSYDEYATIAIDYVPAYIVPTGADWSADTKAAFKDHLGGNTIPYVYLGTTDETATWSEQSSTLEIEGETYFGSLLNGALNTFTSAGWTAAIKTVTYSDDYDSYDVDVMKAEKTVGTDGTKLSVTVGATDISYSGEPSGNCLMDITYVKPYTVPTTAAWDSTTENFIKANLGGHEIPYVYLNSTIITTDSNSYDTPYITLTGGLFVDDILTYAKTQFTAANWTEPTIANGKFTASIVETDGCEIDVEIAKNAYGLVEMTCTFNEAFNTTLTDWSDDFKAKMKNCLNNNVIPFIQLGTVSATCSEYVSDNNVTIKGKLWKDSIVDDAKATLEEAGWSCILDAFSDEKTLQAFIVNSDGSIIALKLYNNGGAYLDVYYYAAATNPSTAKSAWSDAENNFITGVAGSKSSMVPFLYMGNGNYTTKVATTSSDAQITGTGYYAKSVADYYKTLKGLGFTEFELGIEAGSLSLKAKSTLSDGSIVQLETSEEGSGSSKKMTLKIQVVYGFVIPTGDAAKWSDSIKTAITNHIGDGVCIPFIYLGTDVPTTKTYSYRNELDVIGGTWDDQILTLAYNAFKGSTDGWDVVFSKFDNQVIACMTTPSGKNVKVVVKKNTSGKPIIEIYAK